MTLGADARPKLVLKPLLARPLLNSSSAINLSPSNCKGHGVMPCPLFLPKFASRLNASYPAVAATGSSTLASLKNLAASSGGVGLM